MAQAIIVTGRRVYDTFTRLLIAYSYTLIERLVATLVAKSNVFKKLLTNMCYRLCKHVGQIMDYSLSIIKAQACTEDLLVSV